MTAPSDKELRRLLAHADSECVLPFHTNDLYVQDDTGLNAAMAETEGLAQLFACAPDMARELLAARKVVRAAKLELEGWPQDMPKLLAAYDKARKG